jgi:hypothetical protein
LRSRGCKSTSLIQPEKWRRMTAFGAKRTCSVVTEILR